MCLNNDTMVLTKKQKIANTKYYEAHKGEILAKQKIYNKKNNKRINKRKKEYREIHREEALALGKIYRSTDKYKQERKEYTQSKKGKESKQKSDKKYRTKNSKKIRECAIKYYEDNKVDILKSHKEYYENNKEAIQNTMKKYYEENKESINIYNKKYRQDNYLILQIVAFKYRKRNSESLKIWHKDNYNKKRTKDCIICSKKCVNLFCSKKCLGKYYSGSNNNMWNGGISHLPYDINWTEKFKEMIRFRDNYCCVNCFQHQDVFNSKLSIHHIDGIKTNTFKENCVSLCKTCHGVVEAGVRSKNIKFNNILYNKFKIITLPQQ